VELTGLYAQRSILPGLNRTLSASAIRAFAEIAHREEDSIRVENLIVVETPVLAARLNHLGRFWTTALRLNETLYRI
jgi:hypothetical protein